MGQIVQSHHGGSTSAFNYFLRVRVDQVICSLNFFHRTPANADNMVFFRMK